MYKHTLPIGKLCAAPLQFSSPIAPCVSGESGQFMPLHLHELLCLLLENSIPSSSESLWLSFPQIDGISHSELHSMLRASLFLSSNSIYLPTTIFANQKFFSSVTHTKSVTCVNCVCRKTSCRFWYITFNNEKKGTTAQDYFSFIFVLYFPLY